MAKNGISINHRKMSVKKIMKETQGLDVRYDDKIQPLRLLCARVTPSAAAPATLSVQACNRP